jgi:hypothetical protein
VEQNDGVVVELNHSTRNHSTKTMREARTCYDHLAGSVAVEIYEFMQADGWLEPMALLVNSAWARGVPARISLSDKPRQGLLRLSGLE